MFIVSLPQLNINATVIIDVSTPPDQCLNIC